VAGSVLCLPVGVMYVHTHSNFSFSMHTHSNFSFSLPCSYKVVCGLCAHAYECLPACVLLVNSTVKHSAYKPDRNSGLNDEWVSLMLHCYAMSHNATLILLYVVLPNGPH